MSQLGIGVMIRHLCGNESTVTAYKGALGKTIKDTELTDSALILRFTDGTGIRIADEGQSCCEHRYMTTDDDPKEHIGHTFTGAEIKDGPTTELPYGDEHEQQFLEIRTSNGHFTIVTHNEHNGYYGGFSIEVSHAELHPAPPRCPPSYTLPLGLDSHHPVWVRDARGFFVANAATEKLAAFIVAAANAAAKAQEKEGKP